MHLHTSRRTFLKSSAGSAALVTLGGVVPQVLMNASARAAESRGETVLVVIQLSGGNDGLNTVIPFADDAYRKGRPSLAVGAGQVRKIDDRFGFHPSMEGFSKLLEAGRLGIVQGVGYPNPDRSHFSSMDIWHTARPDLYSGRGERDGPGHRVTGWIGRCLDKHPSARADGGHGDMPGLHLGAGRLPLALVGDEIRVSSVAALEGFKLEDGGDARVRAAMQKAASAKRDGADDLVTFLQRGTVSAMDSSRRVQESLGKYKTDVKYPESGLARRLKTVAQLIDAGLGTRVYYLDLDGFDTHANQAAAHTALLTELSGALSAFVNDLDQHGHGKRVMTMTFSEFGRRVRENASQGTDHGAAAPLFVAGGRVKTGLIGKHPSLTDLDDGDLKHTADFRGVYAAVLEQWLGVPSEPVLGGKFDPVRVTA
jgi:uncharacterized protein (DUF1501 family)